MKVSILVPVYNEEKSLPQVFEQLFEQNFIYEIIMVDDGSTDHSFQIMQAYAANNPCVKIFQLARNQGKTAAINFALKHVTGDIIAIQDADLEYNPVDLESCLNPILEGRADVVYGSRFLVKKASRVLYFYHYLANKFLTFLSNCFTNLNMTDIETGYKVFKSSVLKNFELKSRGFGMEIELTAFVAQSKLRIYEVPISYYGRTYEEGKKIGFKDGLMALWYIIYFNIIKRKAGMERFVFFLLLVMYLFVCAPHKVVGTVAAQFSISKLRSLHASLAQARSGENVLPELVQEVVTMIRVRELSDYKVSDKLVGKRWFFEQIIASAWPVQYNDHSKNIFFRINEKPSLICNSRERGKYVFLCTGD